MWFVLYVEGLVMGWVSFYKKNDVCDILYIFFYIDFVVFMLIGYIDKYFEKLILE